MGGSSALERELTAIGRELAAALPGPLRRPRRLLDDRLMDLAAADPRVRAALFRLVDVAPACRSDDELAEHLAGLLEEVPGRRGLGALVSALEDSAPGREGLGATIRAAVRHMAGRFIAGADPTSALPEVERLWRGGVAASVDLLGEATVTAAEADAYAGRCAGALEVLACASARWPSRPRLERDSHGRVPRAELSVKVSALTPLLRPHAPALGVRDAAARLRALLERAHALGAHLHVDSESFDTREAVVELVLGVLSEPAFAAGPPAGLVVQAYLRDSPETVERVLDWAQAGPGAGREVPVTVRLVKGAYWDHEVAEARQHGWRPPVFEDKAACDANFEALSRRLLDARPAVRVAIASHNLRSVAHAIAHDRLSGGTGADLELQVLRGLGDPLAEALAARGLRVRAYCPVGEVVAGMAYLVRRLLENTSNSSFLHEQARGVPLEDLLAPPRPAEPVAA